MPAQSSPSRLSILKAGVRTPARRILLIIIALGLILIVLLAQDVERDLTTLNSAQTDNVLWYLTQTEVELGDLEARVARARAARDADLEPVRRAFDIFYSRIASIERGSIYASLRRDSAYSAALGRVRAFLDEGARLMDGPDADLRAALGTVDRSIHAARGDLRVLSTHALAEFTRRAETLRQNVATTLITLAAVTGALLIAIMTAILLLYRAQDVSTKRRRMIERANLRMNTVISTSLDAAIVTNEDGRITQFNRAAETIFGYAAEDVMGEKVGDMIVPDHLRAAHARGMDRVAAHGERHVIGKGRFRLEGKRRDGTIFPIELTLERATMEGDSIFIAFLRDISDRVEAERQQRAARDQALAGERAKSEFLATMSHEIRTPLNGLLGNLALLEETDLGADQRKLLSRMEASGRLLNRHVADVLDITRYDTGAMILAQVPVDLGALLDDLIETQALAASQNGSTLGWSWTGPPMPCILSDRERLEHILINLIGNAVKFTQDGSIDVRLQASPRADERHDLRIEVRDTGPGIGATRLDTIFDDFVTYNPAPDRAPGGTGLGLGIVKRFVTAMEGRIDVTSTEGEGSSFVVTLPVTPAAAWAPAEADPGPTAPQRSCRILLVEDNEINREVAREMLSRRGHRVIEARNGRAGVDAARDTRFDLILMDISMPLLDGRAATRLIRKGGDASADVPIVALTANVQKGDRETYLSEGFTEVLSKPLSRAALDRMIARILESQDLRIDLDPHLALRETLDADMVTGLVSRLADEVEAFLADVPGMTSAEIGPLAHRTAGSAAMLGFPDLHAALIAAENAAARDEAVDLDGLNCLWSRIRDQLGALS